MATPRYNGTDGVGDAGVDDQVVGRVRMRWVESEAMVQGVKQGVGAFIPAEVSDDVMNNRDDDLGVALDVGVAEVLGVEDVDGVVSDTFVTGARSFATDVEGRGTEEYSARTAGPGRAARELEELVEATAAAPGVPREEVKEP